MMSAFYKTVQSIRKTSIAVIAAVMLCAGFSFSQVEYGNTTMKLNGNLGYSYVGMFGNSFGSSHGQGLSGDGELSGFYFHPNFVSFDVRPYYNRSQSSAGSQLVDQGTGFQSSFNIFQGSSFPGYVTFSKDFDSSSQYFVGGVPSLATNSSGQEFGVTWNEAVKDWPSLSASFSLANSSSSLYGMKGESGGTSKNLSLTSSHEMRGWHLRSTYMRQTSNFEIPQTIVPTAITVGGHGSSISASAGHDLPFSGSLGLGWGHYSGGTGSNSDSVGNSYDASTSFMFFKRLSISTSGNYTTNLTEALRRELLGDTGVAFVKGDSHSHSAGFHSSASITLGHGFSVSGFYSRRKQVFNDQHYGDAQYGGMASYRKQSRFFGFLNFGVGLVDTANKVGNAGTGLVSSVSANRKIKGWEANGDFNYTQYIQTLIAIGSTSSYSYGASARRKVTPTTFFNATFRATHSGLTQQSGSMNRSESFSTAISHKPYSVSATYSQSSGTSIMTATGVLLPSEQAGLLTDGITYFNARSIGVGGSTIVKRILFSANYSMVKSDTVQHPAEVATSGNRFFMQCSYRLRSLMIGAGYSRSSQQTSAIPGGPMVFNAFSVSLTRQFSVF